MRTRFASLMVATAIAMIAAPAVAGKKPEVSGLALQQIQARDYEVTKAVSFPAVMTVLQDAGYRISTADKDTGLITGAASTKSGMRYSLFGGFGKSKKTPVVSAFIEDRGIGSRVRLSFVMAKTKSSLYGMSSSDEEPITDPVTYKAAFEKIEREIFVRQAIAAPTATPPAIAPQPVSAAASHAPNGLIPNSPSQPPALTPNPKPQR